MSHAIILLNIIAMLTGLVVAYVLLLLFKKYQQPIIKRYSWFHGILSLEIGYFVVISYLSVIGIQQPIILIHFIIILDALLIYVVPWFFNHLLSIKKERKYQPWFLALSFMFLIINYGLDILAKSYLISTQTYYSVLGLVDFIVLLPIIYVIYQIINTLRKGDVSLQINSALVKGLIVTTLFFPGFVADLGWFHLKQRFDLIPTGFFFTSIFYFVWNGLFLHGISTYLTIPVNSKEHFQAFYNAHKLSDREQDICSLLLNGMSNHSISKHLFIEESTVKKHLQNIFKKTNVSSRFKLTQLIRGANDNETY